MKFVTTSNKLLKQLQGIGGVLNSSNTLPILDNFLFEIKDNALTVSASDLETTMTTTLEVQAKETGSICVPARMLMDILKAFPDQPLTFNIDSKTYNNVIFNLIGNATKFINYHGWIILEVDIVTSISLTSFNYTNLSRSAVADNGVGMTANTQFLVKSTQSFSSGSTQRLGLSIVKEILSTYCLVLNVISYPSRGAKLYFDIKVFPNNK